MDSDAQWWILLFGIVAMFITGLYLLVRIRNHQGPPIPI